MNGTKVEVKIPKALPPNFFVVKGPKTNTCSGRSTLLQDESGHDLLQDNHHDSVCQHQCQMSADQDSDAARNKRPVTLKAPRFSSYNPPASASASAERRHQPDENDSQTSTRKRRPSHNDEGDSSDKHKKRRYKRSHRQREGESDRHHRPKRQRSRSPTPSIPAASERIEDARASYQIPSFDRDLFFTDTTGDVDALVYGPDKSKIPKAHRASRSQILGYTKQDPAASASTSKGSPADAELVVEKSPESLTLDQLKIRSQGRQVGMPDLPIELLHRVLVLSRSSSFPMTCRYFRQACHQASIEQKVDYVLGRWVDHYIAYTTNNPCQAKHKSCRRLTSRLASLYKYRDPSWFDFFSAISATDCTVQTIRTANLDIVTFAAEVGICSAAVLDRLVPEASASSLPRAFLPGSIHPTGSVSSPQLPKRLFRRIDHPGVDAKPSSEQSVQESATSDQTQPKKQKRRHETANADVDTGPMPSADELQLMFTMIIQYGADASSHQGFPLAMAVHRRSYSLVHLLLLFGADPARKEGLAVQIAIRNGFLEILRLLVSGPCIDADAAQSQSCLIPAGHTLPQQLGSQPFQLDQSHLRLAIQSRQWAIVDFIWHEKKVSPDIACLRLIEKLRH